MPQTNTARINDLAREITILGTKLDERSAQSSKDNEYLRAELAATREELKQTAGRLATSEARNAATEERC